MSKRQGNYKGRIPTGKRSGKSSAAFRTAIPEAEKRVLESIISQLGLNQAEWILQTLQKDCEALGIDYDKAIEDAKREMLQEMTEEIEESSTSKNVPSVAA